MRSASELLVIVGVTFAGGIVGGIIALARSNKKSKDDDKKMNNDLK